MKSLFGYLFCIAIAVLMAVMIDGTGGVLIAAILLLALGMSLFISVYLRNKLTLSIDCTHKLLAKGDIVEVNVKVEKHTRFPSPIIEIRLESSLQLSPVNECGVRFSLLPNRQVQTVKIPFRAEYSGASFIRVAAFEIVDFLGVTRRVIAVDPETSNLDLKIMPNVPDTGTQLEVIRTATDNLGFDDSEDETSETAMGSTGMPGYEHRAYSPGDPLKKINWKMSSKRGIYMVRLDEKLSVTSQVFILDYPTPKPPLQVYLEEYRKKPDVIIEGALAMLSMLTQQGLESDFYYYLEGKWRSMAIKTLGDVYLLAEELAGLVPYDGVERIPKEALRSGIAVCFTTTDNSDQKVSAELLKYPNVTFVIGENTMFHSGLGNFWTISRDFEFKHLN